MSETVESLPWAEPCPFCADTHAQVCSIEGPELVWFVKCAKPECGACGPQKDAPSQAVIAWNYRAGPGRPDILGDFMRATHGDGPIAQATRQAYSGLLNEKTLEAKSSRSGPMFDLAPAGRAGSFDPEKHRLPIDETPTPHQAPIEFGCVPDFGDLRCDEIASAPDHVKYGDLPVPVGPVGWYTPPVESTELLAEDGHALEWCIDCHSLLSIAGRCENCDLMHGCYAHPLYEYLIWRRQDGELAEPPPGEGWEMMTGFAPGMEPIGSDQLLPWRRRKKMDEPAETDPSYQPRKVDIPAPPYSTPPPGVQWKPSPGTFLVGVILGLALAFAALLGFFWREVL